MKAANLAWKSFNVSLAELNKWCLENMPDYDGCGTFSDGVLVYIKGDDETQLQAVRDKWNEIDEDHEWVVAYKPRPSDEQRAARIEAIRLRKIAMVSKTWANMNALERKLVLGLDSEISNKDLGLE